MYGTIAFWATDFVRAARERPLIMRLLFRFAMGKYAYRELVGLMSALDKEGISPYYSYDLEGMDYHGEEVPWDWGKE